MLLRVRNLSQNLRGLTGGCCGDDRREVRSCQTVEDESVAGDERGLELVVLIHSIPEGVVVKYPEEEEERGHEQKAQEKVLEAAPLERRHPCPRTPSKKNRATMRRIYFQLYS